MLVVDAGQISVHHSVVRTQVESSQVRGNGSDENKRIRMMTTHHLFGSSAYLVALRFYFILLYERSDCGSINKLPVKNSGFFQNISKIDVGVQKIGIQTHCFLEMVNGQPDLTLCVEDAAEVTPGHREIRTGFNGFQIARLFQWNQSGRRSWERGRRKKIKLLEHK